jgi:microsomal epoxide hydrolase
MKAKLTRRAVVAAAPALSIAPMGKLLPSSAWSASMTDDKVRPYKINVPDATLRRIRERVASAHLPKTSKGAGWRYGPDADWFGKLVAYWRDTYDWRQAEADLNETPQFETTIDGRALHFARLSPRTPSRHPPILVLHGWPCTFATMLPLARLLKNAGLEVIVPSLPGYGFSQPADDQVRGLRFISARLHRLMTDVLGYERYIIQGGDHGAVVADWLAIDHPGNVVGIHANMIAFRHAGAEFGSGKTGVSDAAPEEEAYAKAEVENMEKESAYFRLQATRPETIAYALADSPVGWAAYMLDKWQKWSDTQTRPFEQAYTRDSLLTEVMIYLVTDSVATSIWPYAGFATEPFGLQPGQTIAQPFGHSSFEDPLLPRMPRKFVARSRTDIRLWREYQGGGHFPMLQATDVLAKDVVDFVEMLA